MKISLLRTLAYAVITACFVGPEAYSQTTATDKTAGEKAAGEKVEVTTTYRVVWVVDCRDESYTDEEYDNSEEGALAKAYAAADNCCSTCDGCTPFNCEIAIGWPEIVQTVIDPKPDSKTPQAQVQSTGPVNVWKVRYTIRFWSGRKVSIAAPGRTYCEAYHNARRALCKLVDCCTPCAWHSACVVQRPTCCCQ